MSFSNSFDERFGGNQYMYMRSANTNYIFNFMIYPSKCIANKGGPLNEMNC